MVPYGEPRVTQRNLVIVRAGDASLHEQWLTPGAPRTWDLIVSYYGDDPEKFRADALRRIDLKGGKLSACFVLFDENSRLLDAYDYFWVADDDVLTDAVSINRMFALMKAHGLSLAQPALTPDSYIAHRILVRLPAFILRYTNFVEVMAPCFSAAFLTRVLPTFEHRVFGRGLDSLWPALLDEPLFKTAVLDAVAMRHTRPRRTSELYKTWSPEDERHFNQSWTPLMDKPDKAIYGAITRAGVRLRRGVGLCALVMLAAAWNCRPWSKLNLRRKRYRKHLYRHASPWNPRTELSVIEDWFRRIRDAYAADFKRMPPAEPVTSDMAQGLASTRTKV